MQQVWCEISWECRRHIVVPFHLPSTRVIVNFKNVYRFPPFIFSFFRGFGCIHKVTHETELLWRGQWSHTWRQYAMSGLLLFFLFFRRESSSSVTFSPMSDRLPGAQCVGSASSFYSTGLCRVSCRSFFLTKVACELDMFCPGLRSRVVIRTCGTVFFRRSRTNEAFNIGVLLYHHRFQRRSVHVF